MKFRFSRASATFLYVWLMVGFASGTAVLIGPVRWVVGALRAAGAERFENAAMIAVILAYVVASFLLARWLVGWMGRRTTLRTRAIVPVLATVAAGAALWGWSNPAVYASVAGSTAMSEVSAGSAQFVFGPYPNRARLEELKTEGFAGVISLQHPSVVPFEPVSIAEEKTATRELGIEFVHAPMLPWISSNEESLAIVKHVAQTGRGRYYVHCGLGRDRTGVVQRMLQRMGKETQSARDRPEATTWAARIAQRDNNSMERGTLHELEKDVWLVPFPNKHEMYGHMLAGQNAHVLLLLHPEMEEHQPWIAQAQKVFQEYGVPYTLFPVRGGESAQMQRAAAKARSLPRPLTIVVPQTPPLPFPEVFDQFTDAYVKLAGIPLPASVAALRRPSAKTASNAASR